jgi:hypothetical protein
MMWGADYPHTEGCHPYTAESLRWTFGDVPPEDTELMLGRNAADVYGFDHDGLQAVADRIGPTVAELSEGLSVDDIPRDAETHAFGMVPV